MICTLAYMQQLAQIATTFRGAPDVIVAAGAIGAIGAIAAIGRGLPEEVSRRRQAQRIGPLPVPYSRPDF
ncbi:MAG: hypothetical protein ACKVQU_19560 [Burkholderiales bacterium]